MIFKRNADNHLGIKHGAKKPPRAGSVAADVAVVVAVAFAIAGVDTVDAAAESSAAAVAVVVPVAFAFDDALAVPDLCRVYIYIHGIFTHLVFSLKIFSILDLSQHDVTRDLGGADARCKGNADNHLGICEWLERASILISHFAA